MALKQLITNKKSRVVANTCGLCCRQKSSVPLVSLTLRRAGERRASHHGTAFLVPNPTFCYTPVPSFRTTAPLAIQAQNVSTRLQLFTETDKLAEQFSYQWNFTSTFKYLHS